MSNEANSQVTNPRRQEHCEACADALNKCDKMLEALNEMDIMLLSQKEGSFDDIMSSSLKPVAEAAGLDRIVVYRLIDIEGVKRFGQVFRWDKTEGGLVPIDDFLRILPNIPVIESWLSNLLGGSVINTYLSAAKKDEVAILNAYSIKSYLLIPVIIDNKPWGGVAFQDHTNERQFDNDSINFLSSAAKSCTNAIIRHENIQHLLKSEEILKSHEKMIDTLNKASIIFLSQDRDSFESMMTAGLQLIVDVLDLDRISVWRNTMMTDGLHANRIYQWDKQSGGTALMSPEFADILYSRYIPRWEGLLSGGESINSPVSLLPEASILKSFGIVSLFVTPLVRDNLFWGFVIFEDRRIIRYFDENSAEMMRSAALICANTVIVHEKNLIEKIAAEKTKQREQMLFALNKMANVFLSNEYESLDDAMNLGLKPVAGLTGVDRFAVYKATEDGSKLRQVYLWSSRTTPYDDELRKTPFDAPTQWLETLKRGSCINANVMDMVKDESDWLGRYGIMGIYFVPVISRGNFWGAVALEDHSNYRCFDDNYLDLLQSAARLCASAFIREETKNGTKK